MFPCWRFPWITKWDLNTTDPIVVRERLFISTFDRGCALLQLNGTELKLVRTNQSMANHFNSCVDCRNAQGVLVCLDVRSGGLR